MAIGLTAQDAGQTTPETVAEPHGWEDRTPRSMGLAEMDNASHTKQETAPRTAPVVMSAEMETRPEKSNATRQTAQLAQPNAS